MKKTLLVLVGGFLAAAIGLQWLGLAAARWSEHKPVLKPVLEMSAPEEWKTRYATKDGPVVGTYFKPKTGIAFLFSMAFEGYHHHLLPARRNRGSGQIEWLHDGVWKPIPLQTVVIDTRKGKVPER